MLLDLPVQGPRMGCNVHERRGRVRRHKTMPCPRPPLGKKSFFSHAQYASPQTRWIGSTCISTSVFSEFLMATTDRCPPKRSAPACTLPWPSNQRYTRPPIRFVGRPRFLFRERGEWDGMRGNCLLGRNLQKGTLAISNWFRSFLLMQHNVKCLWRWASLRRMW